MYKTMFGGKVYVEKYSQQMANVGIMKFAKQM
jgi:hypothetical protein